MSPAVAPARCATVGGMTRSAPAAEPPAPRPRRRIVDLLIPLVVVVAVGKIAAALILVATHTPFLSARAIPAAVLVAHVGVFGGAAAFLAGAGRHDRRAVHLGLFFLLVAVSFSNGLVARLEGLSGGAAQVYQALLLAASRRVPAAVPVAVRPAFSPAASRRSRPSCRERGHRRGARRRRAAVRGQRLAGHSAGATGLDHSGIVVRRRHVRAGHSRRCRSVCGRPRMPTSVSGDGTASSSPVSPSASCRSRRKCSPRRPRRPTRPSSTCRRGGSWSGSCSIRCCCRFP